MMLEPLKRHDDWYVRLDGFVAGAARTPFEPGQHDCALFAATGLMVQSVAAIDFAAEFRGRYATLEAGLKLLQEAGYADHVALAADRLIEIPPALARIGDVAAVDFGAAGMALTIVGGQHLVGPMPDGRGSVSRLMAVRAFTAWWRPEA
jgi:hypothetical protein